MDNLFAAERRQTKRNSVSVLNTGNSDIVKHLKKLEDGGKTAIQRTVSDFSKRAPGWISKGIRENYGVDTKAIKDATLKPRRGKPAKIVGIVIDNITLPYVGTTLTPLHFKMSPKRVPNKKEKKHIRIPGQAIGTKVAMMQQPKKYDIKATVIKGKRSVLPKGTFLAPTRGGVVLPFQKTEGSRMPIEAVRTLSVPQMIDGRAHDAIEKAIDTNLNKRFEHNIQQVMK